MKYLANNAKLEPKEKGASAGFVEIPGYPPITKRHGRVFSREYLESSSIEFAQTLKVLCLMFLDFFRWLFYVLLVFLRWLFYTVFVKAPKEYWIWLTAPTEDEKILDKACGISKESRKRFNEQFQIYMLCCYAITAIALGLFLWKTWFLWVALLILVLGPGSADPFHFLGL